MRVVGGAELDDSERPAERLSTFGKHCRAVRTDGLSEKDNYCPPRDRPFSAE